MCQIICRKCQQIVRYKIRGQIIACVFSNKKPLDTITFYMLQLVVFQTSNPSGSEMGCRTHLSGVGEQKTKAITIYRDFTVAELRPTPPDAWGIRGNCFLFLLNARGTMSAFDIRIIYVLLYMLHLHVIHVQSNSNIHFYNVQWRGFLCGINFINLYQTCRNLVGIVLAASCVFVSDPLQRRTNMV